MNLAAAKRWWIDTFECEEIPLPTDDPCPSSVALALLGGPCAAVLLGDRSEAEKAGLGNPSTHPIIFCNKIKKAHEHLVARRVPAGPIQTDGTSQYFEIRDPEGNVIEICQAP